MLDFEAINHEEFMWEALREAKTALERGDRPIGAVIVYSGEVIGRGANAFYTQKSNIEHAEMRALRDCAGFLQKNGPDCIIYSTIEPCIMCLGAIVMCDIKHIVFGIDDNWIKPHLALENTPHIRKRVRRYVGGILEDECGEIYRRFSKREYIMMTEGRVIED